LLEWFSVVVELRKREDRVCESREIVRKSEKAREKVCE